MRKKQTKFHKSHIKVVLENVELANASKLPPKEQLKKDRDEYKKLQEPIETNCSIMEQLGINSELAPSAPIAPIAPEMRAPEEEKINTSIQRERRVSMYEKFNYSLPGNITKSQRMAMANEMLVFIVDKLAKKELVLLDDYPLSKKWHPRKFYHLADHDDDFKDALEIAKIFVSNQLQKGGLVREFDAGLIAKLLPYYDSEYKEFLREMAKDFQPSNVLQRVVYEEVPRNAMVPERRKDE